jgi:hypothetical protein
MTMRFHPTPITRRARFGRRQSGLSLIELMVGIGIDRKSVV